MAPRCFLQGLAEVVGKHLSKGSQVYVEGKLRTRKWTDKGVERYTTEIVATEMVMLGKKPAGGVTEAPADFAEPESDGEIPF